MENEASVGPAPAGELTIEQDTPCIACGYNLRGLSPKSGLCPECGRAVFESIRGDLLRFSDQQWLIKLRFGTGRMLWSILLSIVLVAGGEVVTSMGAPAALGLLADISAELIFVWAIFAFTEQEPRVNLCEQPFALRKALRFLAVASACASILSCLPIAGWPLTTKVLEAAGLLLGGVGMAGSLFYLRRFAFRIPDRSLARSTRNLIVFTCILGAAWISVELAAMASGPIAGFGLVDIAWVGLSLALLAFLVWYIRVIVRYRRAFKQAIEAEHPALSAASMYSDASPAKD